MSGSALSGTNDPDSQDEEEESEMPIDEASIASERPRGIRKNIRFLYNKSMSIKVLQEIKFSPSWLYQNE